MNANGAALKKKQLWTLEPCCVPGEDQAAVRLRSHLGRYLAVDQFGNVTCEDEEAGEGSRFHITVSGDSRGQWALRNSNRGYFLGASGDQLVCVAKAPGSAELWTVHLAARPQVGLPNGGAAASHFFLFCVPTPRVWRRSCMVYVSLAKWQYWGFVAD